MSLKQSNSFTDNKSYSRVLDEIGYPVYIIPGVIKREFISNTLLSRVNDVRYEYSNSGFTTNICIGRYCKEDDAIDFILELVDKLDEICYSEDEGFKFKLWN